MGVTGLWRLIDASGKPVPVETLEGKILAIDISIWIHQVLQGYQDRRGNSVPNAHLLGLYTRICKLLYFKIKPIFVFDGGVPLLKKNTIAARKKHKAAAAGKAAQMKNDLLHNLMKHSLVKGVLSKKINEEPGSSSRSDAKKTDKSVIDIFKLPQLPADHVDEADSDDLDTSNELSPRKQQKWKGNIHTVDVTCDDFKSLPPDVRYDILTDLKETRKQNSWGKLHEIPEESNEFSNYQMERLLKRRNVQVSLEAAEQEMGGKTLTLDELEKLMTDQGVVIKGRDAAYRIASDSSTRMIYVNDIKGSKSSQEQVKNDDNDDDQSKPGCSKDPEDNSAILFNIEEYDIDGDDEDWDSDIEFIEQAVATPTRKKYFGKVTSNPALAYMLENTELSQEQILELIEQSKNNVRNSRKINGKKRLLNGESETSFAKKKKEFDFSISEFVTVKEEIVSDDDDDGGEVGIERTVVEEKQEKQKEPTVSIMSDSESDDDFIEVQGSSLKTESKKIEITIKENQELQDDEDIFADVFSAEPVVDIFSNNEESFEKIHEADGFVEKKETVKSKNSLSIFLEDPVTGKIDHPQVQIVERQGKLLTQSLDVDKAQPQPLKINENIPERLAKPEEPKKILSPDKTREKTPDNKAFPEPELKTPEKPSKPVGETSDRVSRVISLLEKDKEQLLLNSNNSERLLEMQTELETESALLREDIGKFERQSTEVTAQMRSEAQELLRLFGIPYIVAPQEAEAQCAYLETLSLTDGTITDDSDIWLFGGRCVYKNFFNNTKQVMQYQAQDIERHFKLSRNQMIQLALLVGSDYTVGVPGIGPVTALEVIASFPSQGDDLLRGLANFSTWLNNGRIVAGPGKATLRNKLKNVTIHRGFPSQAVVQAYLFPTVDESTEKFTWSKPNIVLLGDYTRTKFGWTKMKFDETMGPIIKKINEHQTQKNLLKYFKVQGVPKSIEENLSKRVQKAVQRMGKDPGDTDDPDDVAEEDGSLVKKRKKPAKKRGKKSNEEEEVFGGLEDNGGVKKEKKGEEIIPQREKDRQIAMKKKLEAIEIFKKGKRGKGRGKNIRPARQVVKEQANLSESSSDD